MNLMWICTGIWTVGVFIVSAMMSSDPYNYPTPINIVTVVDTWFKGFVVIAAFCIVNKLSQRETEEQDDGSIPAHGKED